MSDWPLRKLGDVATVTAGTSAPQGDKYFDGGRFNFVRTQDVGRYGFTTSLIETKDRVNELAVREKRLKKARKGASVFPKSGASILTNSRAMLGCDSYIVSHLAIVDANKALLDDYYLHYFLRTVDFGEIAQSEEGYPSLRLSEISELDIPIPPIDEQRRIVARIEELTRRAEEARKLAAEREAELAALLQALYSRMIEGVEWKPLKEIASLVRRAVKTKPDGRYEEMGIRSFGKGTFQKPVLTGKQIGNKRIYTIHEGDLVFNNVFAWEKAIAVAKPEDHGRVGSHRFITYLPHEGQATSGFLCHHFLGERGIEDIRAASPGSAGRNRTLGLKKLEKILVPVPEYDEQKRFAEIAKRRQLIQLETAGIEEELNAFHAALLAKAFRGEL
jgi:type I restriction enzyme S subunit